MYDKQELARQIVRLKLRIDRAGMVVVGAHLGVFAIAFVAGYTQHPLLARMLGIAAFISLAVISTALISEDLDLGEFEQLFEDARSGGRTMLVAHDALFSLTGRRTDDIFLDALLAIQEVIRSGDLNPQVITMRLIVHPADIERIVATGISPGKSLSGSVSEISEKIVREAMHRYTSKWVDGEKLPMRAQEYLLANDPMWVQARPSMFDAIVVDRSHAGLLALVHALQPMGLQVADQVHAVRQWLSEHAAGADFGGENLPELSMTTSM